MVLRDLIVLLGFDVDQSGYRKADNSISSIKNKAASLIGTVGRLAGILGLAFSAAQSIQMIDAFKEVNARVSLTTSSLKEQEEVTRRIFDIAQDTRQEYTATADLYSRVARNAAELGTTQKEVLNFTQDVNKAMIVGGGGAQESKAAILQLGQALASGRLQGDELRSILENAPRLARAIAAGLGVGLGQLRQMGKEGALGAKEIFEAVRSQSDLLAREFARMPITNAQARTMLMNSIGKFLSEFEKGTGIADAIARGIRRIALGIDSITKKMPQIIHYLKIALYLVTAIALQAKGGALAKAFMIVIGPVRRFIAAMMLSYKLVGVLGIIKIAIKGIGMLLMRIPVIALIVGILLLLEDLYYWITGGESVLGEWLGSWEDFKNKVSKWIDELIAKIQPFIDLIKEAANLWNKWKQDKIDAALDGTGVDGPGYPVGPLSPDPSSLGGAAVTGTTNNSQVSVDASVEIKNMNVGSAQEAAGVVNGFRKGSAQINPTRALQYGGGLHE